MRSAKNCASTSQISTGCISPPYFSPNRTLEPQVPVQVAQGIDLPQAPRMNAGAFFIDMAFWCYIVKCSFVYIFTWGDRDMSKTFGEQSHERLLRRAERLVELLRSPTPPMLVMNQVALVL